MFLLKLVQLDYSHNIGLFDTIENGRKFVSQLPGYKLENIIDEDVEYEIEKFNYKDISNYEEFTYNGNTIPLTKFMFTEDADVEIVWEEIVNLEQNNNCITNSCTKVDAYIIDNSKLKNYIEKRERKISWVLDHLGSLGYKAERAYFGSEDGEAINYQKPGEKHWFLLDHIDPYFVEQTPDEKREFIKVIEEMLRG